MIERSYNFIEQSELDPEALQNVMAKVQDINAEGTAYTFVRSKAYPGEKEMDPLIRLELILQQGLKGTPTNKPTDQSHEEIRNPENSRWYENARNKKDASVHFNIIGRSRKPGDLEPITNINALSGYNSRFRIIFDMDSYKELDPMYERGAKEIKQFNHTFRANLGARMTKEQAIRGKEMVYDEQGRPMPITEYGFVASFRIAPRRFKGIVLSSPTEDLQKVIEIMNKVDKEKPELLLPVYDSRGNLLWPKKMSYAELEQPGKDE